MSEVDPLFARPLVPVSNDADAARTAAAVFPYLAAVDGRATVVHVIEKAGGAPDKAPLEQREELAEELFADVREAAADAGVDVETELLYGTDVAETILDAARETDATAIVFAHRGGRAWWNLFSGDVRETLTTESDVPVVVFPEGVEDAETPGDDDDAETSDESSDPDGGDAA
ncbi:universal stress protein [Halobellus inordinatus]|uniref:universal stress protein n=1 Tax=Halobellus inordinatus TaxID=1126236 RepID=UPI0021159A7A|nr:universal stress protein [Halobellus ramosii]